jgi:hypothetical protein
MLEAACHLECGGSTPLLFFGFLFLPPFARRQNESKKQKRCRATALQIATMPLAMRSPPRDNPKRDSRRNLMSQKTAIMLGCVLGFVFFVGIGGFIGLQYHRMKLVEELTKSGEEILKLNQNFAVAAAEAEINAAKLNPVEDLDLPPRIVETLKEAGIVTIGDLLEKNTGDLLAIRGLNDQTVQAIGAALDRRDLPNRISIRIAP